MLILSHTGDDRPDMRDLNRYIVEQQAAQWERLGLELGLEDYHIANISKDNEHNPSRSVTCRREMLQKWLREIPSPSWSKLDDAIKKIKSLTTGSLSTISIRSHSTGSYSGMFLLLWNKNFTLRRNFAKINFSSDTVEI